MSCKLCGEAIPFGGSAAHRWDKHRPEALKQLADARAGRGSKTPKAKKDGSRASPTGQTPTGTGGKSIASVVAPGAGAILFKFGSEEIPMNPLEMTRCYEYFCSLQRNLHLKGGFTAVMEDAMDILHSVLVEGHCILPQVGPMPVIVEEESEQEQEEDNGGGEGLIGEALAEAISGTANTD